MTEYLLHESKIDPKQELQEMKILSKFAKRTFNHQMMDIYSKNKTPSYQEIFELAENLHVKFKKIDIWFKRQRKEDKTSFHQKREKNFHKTKYRRLKSDNILEEIKTTTFLNHSQNIRNEQQLLESDNNMNDFQDSNNKQNLSLLEKLLKITQIDQDQTILQTQSDNNDNNDRLEEPFENNEEFIEAMKICEDFIYKSPNEMMENLDNLEKSTKKLAAINKKLIFSHMFKQHMGIFSNLTKHGI